MRRNDGPISRYLTALRLVHCKRLEQLQHVGGTTDREPLVKPSRQYFTARQMALCKRVELQDYIAPVRPWKLHNTAQNGRNDQRVMQLSGPSSFTLRIWQFKPAISQPDLPFYPSQLPGFRANGWHQSLAFDANAAMVAMPASYQDLEVTALTWPHCCVCSGVRTSNVLSSSGTITVAGYMPRRSLHVILRSF
jgi:hypothetical protein